MPEKVHSSQNSYAWREQELLLMREVMRLVGRSPAPSLALGKTLHLMSELLGLNRGRIVLLDAIAADPAAPRSASIHHAYGLTHQEIARGS
jgi:Nif-specific regulatory protein